MGTCVPSSDTWCTCPRRYLMVVLTCLGMLAVHAMRVNIGVTIVALIDDSLDSEPLKPPYERDYRLDWSPAMVGMLHASFYIGYLFTQVPGGYLCQILPSHRIFGCSILLSSVLNLFVPVILQYWGYVSTCVTRALQGLSEGLLFPSSYAVLRHWTTPQERSCMGAIVLTGVYTGPVLGLMTSGWITHFYGWTHVFYFSGACGIVWFVFWLFLSYETPALHPTISTDELKLIHDRQGETAIIYEHDRVPWRAILTSLPVHSLNVCNFARSFVFFFLLTNEPLFLNVFGFNLAENGVLSSLPHVFLVICAGLSGPLADCLINRTSLSTTTVRKVFTCAGFGFEGLAMLALGFLSNKTLVLMCLTVGVGISGFTISGWQINHLDLAPRYASVLVGITTAVGTLAGIVNPILVGWMTPNQTVSEWHHVFLVTAAVLFFAVCAYCVFGSGEKQKWAEPSPRNEIITSEVSPFKQSPYSAFPTQYGTNITMAALGDQHKPSIETPQPGEGDTTHVPNSEPCNAEPDLNDPMLNQNDPPDKAALIK